MTNANGFFEEDESEFEVIGLSDFLIYSSGRMITISASDNVSITPAESADD